MAALSARLALTLCLFLAACGNGNPAGNYSSDSSPILPAMAETSASLDLMIPLDNAVLNTNPQRFSIRGKFIQIDPGSTGQANLRINSISDTPRLAYPGSQFSPGDFTDLYFDYQAQPGKFLHVLYGDSPDILSAGTKVSVDAAIAPQTFVGEITPVAGNIPVITAAQNINGVKIISGIMALRAAAVNTIGNVARLVAAYPAAPDIFIAALTLEGNAINPTYQSINIQPIYIAPGIPITFYLDFYGPAHNDFATLILNYQLL